MSTNPTLQTDSSPQLMRVLSVGNDCEALLSCDGQGNPVELRVLGTSGLAIDTCERVARQLSLIEIARHPSIRSIAQPLTDSQPRRFALSLPRSVDPIADRLDHTIDSLSARQRIHVATQMTAAVDEAHRIGLCHGSFAASTILVDRSGETPTIYIDFSSTSFDADVTVGPLSVEDDLALLKTLLGQLLLPVMESPDEVDAMASIGGRQRAMLKLWLSTSDQLPPTIGQWQSVLEPLSGKPVQVSIDQTGVVNPSLAKQPGGSTSNLENMSAFGNNEATVVPDVLGRFQVIERIGEGGMGAVYRAVDSSNGQTVALKVLRNQGRNIAQSVRRFRKEARLLRDAQNEHVTRLIDVGEDQGFHFLAMEFVDGIDLKQWLVDRGPLSESDALRITADMARALVEAHSREVVHRDIKPENVLLKLRGDGRCDSMPRIQRPITDFTVKLTDFGIARHVSQSESMDVTAAGAILGTPKYMSPEQCKSADQIGPAADVYSLGITMYQLLTGTVPFESDDFMKLAAMHCFDAPTSVQKRVAEISDLTARIVDRALAKDPADRYGDADQMLAELSRVLRGDTAAIAAHPQLPAHDRNKLWDKTVRWDLVSEPQDLWPLVSNTERLNEAIGLPAVNYRTESDPKLGTQKFGSFTLSGVKVSWEEHPFEWIEGQRMGILREFDAGPFKWFMSVVTLDKQPGGGTTLSHQVRIEPRNFIGRVLTTVEADWKGFKNLKRVYERMDRSIQSRQESESGNGGSMDPFADTKAPSKQVHQRIDERIEQVIQKGADHAAASALRHVLLDWAPQELSHLRPLDVADRLGIDGAQMINACLMAATEGLLNLRWDILCPACRVSASTTELLSEINSHTHCEACDVDFQSNLGDAIEMVFRAHPEIRDVNEGQYCIGGPEHSPHVVAQVRLQPGECLELSLNLGEGDYLVRGPRLAQNGRVRVQTASAPSATEFVLSQLGGPNTPKLRTGQQAVTLTNDLDSLHVVRIERTIPRDDVVTAAMATANPVFRRLFPSQNFAVDTPIETDTISFLATVVADVDHLYQTMGDTHAYGLVQRHHQILSDAVTTSGGTVVKTIGERMLAAFPRREQAVDAAVRIRQSLADDLSGNEFALGIGVHCGPTLVATQNNQLDYFGATVRAVSGLPDLAGTDTLVTQSVYRDAAVRQRYFSNQDHVDVETVKLPGSPSVHVKRITLNQREES